MTAATQFAYAPRRLSCALEPIMAGRPLTETEVQRRIGLALAKLYEIRLEMARAGASGKEE